MFPIIGKVLRRYALEKLIGGFIHVYTSEEDECFENLRVILDSAAPTNLISLHALDELGLKYIKQTCSAVTGIGGPVWPVGIVELRFELPATSQLDDKNKIYQAVFYVLDKNAGITFDVLLSRPWLESHGWLWERCSRRSWIKTTINCILFSCVISCGPRRTLTE